MNQSSQIFNAFGLRVAQVTLAGTVGFDAGDGYAAVAGAELYPWLSAEKTDTGVYTLTFDRKFPKVVSVQVSYLCAAGTATRNVVLKSFDTNTIVVNVVNTTNGALAAPVGGGDKITVLVTCQNSGV